MTSEDLRPIAAYFVGPRVSQERVQREIEESGIRAVFFETESELDELLLNERLFAVFIDLDATKENSARYLGRMRGDRCKWVVMARGLKMQQSQSILGAGASDVLPHPVHPVTVKSRTRMLLIRYLKSYDMPAGTVFPPGVSPREAGKERATGDFSSGDNDSYNYVGGDVAAEAKYGNQKSDAAGVESLNYGQVLSEKHQENAYGNPRGEGPAEAVPTLGASGAAVNSAGGSHTHMGKDGHSPVMVSAPEIVSQRSQAQTPTSLAPPAHADFLGATHAQSKSKAEAPRWEPLAENRTNRSPFAEGSNPATRGPLGASKNASSDPSERSPRHRRPKRSEDFETIKERMLNQTILLADDRPLTAERWPVYESRHAKSSSLSSYECLEELNLGLGEIYRVLSPLSLFLFSLRPHTLNEELPPTNLFQLSGEGLEVTAPDLPIASELFPQIEIALDKTQAVAVNEKSPKKVGQSIRPRAWMSLDEDDASVVVPLYEQAIPFAVILIMFKEKITPVELPVIEEATNVIVNSRPLYLMADYFGRVYRDAIF